MVWLQEITRSRNVTYSDLRSFLAATISIESCYFKSYSQIGTLLSGRMIDECLGD